MMMNMMYSLSTKQQNALSLINFFPEEIVRKILKHKAHLEMEDARTYYNQQMSVFNMDNYYFWHEYDRKLAYLIQSMHIMNTPNFWKLVSFDDQGLISGTQSINSYTYTSTSFQESWWKQKVKGTLQKVHLLNRESSTISLVWQQNVDYPHHNISIFFIMALIEDPHNDQMIEQWVLYN